MPEFVSSGGVLTGTINLTEEHQRIATSVTAALTSSNPQPGTVTVNCAPQLVRIFRGEGLPPQPKAQPEVNMADPIPGPTLRAKVGDLVQLRFVNQVDSSRFDQSIDIDECMTVVQGGQPHYPIGAGNATDKFPNCLHASSTANIHFHGTHTNPNSTGDNVYLQVRPLPRNNQGTLTTSPADAMVAFDVFFKNCADQLKNPLNSWPVTWDDLPKPYIDKQTELLKAYQAKFPGQNLWDEDQEMIKEGTWPIYYIGAVPFCYALPAYTAAVWPPPAGSTSPNMGQAPGTHWYHAHKHGSTHINVLNGMSGVFIIEGKYDDDLNAAYGSYMVRGTPWNARSQPVLLLNQLATDPNLLTPQHSGAGPGGIDMSVNGRLRPKLQMAPGEVQLWRIVNSSARNAAYFMAPEGFAWRQIAEDGVQFNDDNYRTSENRPFYIAPANRVDLLVKAPMKETGPDKPLEVWVQTVMSRSQARPTPASPSVTDPKPGTVLMSVEVKGPPVMQNGRPVQMSFLSPAPKQPVFLADITDAEWRDAGYKRQGFKFNSNKKPDPIQHTINGIQWEDKGAHAKVVLGGVEEWTISNTTNKAVGPNVIDHPFHIHINPFQLTEFFDPNENMTNHDTGQLLGNIVNGKTLPIPQYRIKGQTPTVTDPRQCELDPDTPTTWVPCPNAAPLRKGVWWDVFAIPSGVGITRTGKPEVLIPGYFKMRSRFVDYPGLYVFHCHILIHEDRGMMFSMEVVKGKVSKVRHH